MSLCLYECLRAVGLQHHYARFTSVGVCHAAHLSELTVEDYPLLGIRSMEDRTRLFQLVQLVKTLDLENLGYDEGDANYDYVGSSSSRDGFRNPDEDISNGENDSGGAMRRASTTGTSCVRRLDFSDEATHHQRKLFSCPGGTGHVYASHNTNNEPLLGRVSHLDNGSAGAHGCQKHNNYTPDVHSHSSNLQKGEIVKQDVTGRISMSNSNTTSPSHCVPCHKQKHSPLVASNTFNSKTFVHRKRASRKHHLYTEKDSGEAFEPIVMPTPVYEAKRQAGYNYGLPLSSPPAANKGREAGEQRISVCVRKRPLTCAESRRGEVDAVTTSGGDCVIVHESKEAVDLKQYILQHRFYFDQVFGEESSNKEVYQRTAYPLVQHMLNGGKATCFAYGQTGAGKTHTMLGSSPGRPGLYALAVRDIFAHLSTTHAYSSLQVYVSFFEIYCGQLYDLLDHRKRLFAREDGQKVVHISGLRNVRVDSVNLLLEVISQGTEERTQGVSGVNPLSSRSHALLQIQLRDQNQRITGRMWFVDLAGSERASDAKEPGKQSRMEGAEINRSLLALKECIRSLDREESHTPFRQSKLTQVLKDSFVGDSMTCMIANISPGHTASEHTLNTLRYADRVKELPGHRGLRGRRKGKTVPVSKHDLSHSSSGSRSGSGGTRGKSPPKKPKLGIQSNAFGSNTPNTKSPVVGAILCSTPKSSRCGEETNAKGGRGIGLEHTTPVSGWLGMGDKRRGSMGARQRESMKTQSEIYTDSIPSVRPQHAKTKLMLGQSVDKHLSLWEEQRKCALSSTNAESGFKRKENLQELRQVEHIRDTHVEADRQSRRGLQKADERHTEREMHLRRYHEQLQQFMPTFISAHMCQGLHEVLDAYKAKAEVRVDGNNVDTRGEESRFECDRGRRRSTEAAGEVRVRRDDWRPFGMEGGERRRRKWAWGATADTESANRMTGAIPGNAGAQSSYGCDSEDRGDVGVEGLNTSDVTADNVWNTEQGVAAGSSNDSSHLFRHPPFESPHQLAPAERPLSPACEHTNIIQTPDELTEVCFGSKHTECSNTLSSNSQLQKEGFAAISSGRQLPLTSAITQIGCKNPSESLKLSEPPAGTQEHNSPDDTISLNYTMELLSISLLQVDQQPATVSFLQGGLYSTSLCWPETETRENNRGQGGKHFLLRKEMLGKNVEDEDAEFRLSLLELPVVKTCHSTASDTTEWKTDRTLQVGRSKSYIHDVVLQQQETNSTPQTTAALSNKAPVSPLKPSGT
ncbi:kinesin-like protein KIN-14L [Parambassis ranga]|uniref:Kinesin-like protein KIN-14L n=1 Tax=Parambassis ranga TaxID=210632 RepID=A0A6P7IZF5_9TELE|nr:kinesin-like protein KIN-14L [Parambassis ranga]